MSEHNSPSPSNGTSNARPPPAPSTSSSSTSSSTPKQAPSSLSEWQLMAVLHKANLLQYYEVFIAQGGDDINQIMQCDEGEFMEIMSLVGMLSKPLHVRRLQRTLTDFSKDPASFNLSAMQSIGAPPLAPPFPGAPADPLQLILPGIHAGAIPPSLSPGVREGSPSSSGAAAPNLASQLDFSPLLASIGATANVLPGDYLQSLVANATSQQHQNNHKTESSSVRFANSSQLAAESRVKAEGKLDPTGIARACDRTQASARAARHSSSPAPASHAHSLPAPHWDDDFLALGDHDPALPPSCTPCLSPAQLARLAAAAASLIPRCPPTQPKMVQNKKKISKDLLDVMSLPSQQPSRIDEFRRYAAIYGRFDAKRDKILTLHEVCVNEAAAQLCLHSPALLTRRDELFTMARQVVKEAGYNYKRDASSSSFCVSTRKRPADGASPSLSTSPCPEDEEEPCEKKEKEEEQEKEEKGEKKVSHLELWAAAQVTRHD